MKRKGENDMALTNQEIETYLQSTKRILLSTVTEDNKSDVRILGAIATDGFKTYFSTATNARKVAQIEKKLTCEKGIERATALIKEKLPKFELTADKSIFVVEPEEIKIFNSSAELAQDKIQILKF